MVATERPILFYLFGLFELFQKKCRLSMPINRILKGLSCQIWCKSFERLLKIDVQFVLHVQNNYA